MSRRKGTSRAPPDLIIAASLRRREPELAGGPWECNLGLAALELADARRGERRRQTRGRGEEPGQKGGRPLAVGDKLPRVRTALEFQARQPRNHVEHRIADVSQVPV